MSKYTVIVGSSVAFNVRGRSLNHAFKKANDFIGQYTGDGFTVYCNNNLMYLDNAPCIKLSAIGRGGQYLHDPKDKEALQVKQMIKLYIKKG